MSRVFLKIKIKSLAAEARMIRHEELKFIHHPSRHNTSGLIVDGSHPTRAALYHHRVDVVRAESRAALLAYGYLRGRTYAQMEAKATTPPDWANVTRLVSKYGDRVKAQVDGVKAWAEGGPALPKPDRLALAA